MDTARHGPPVQGGEFTVPGAAVYDVRSPLRWIVSHVARYPWLLVLFAGGTIMLSVATAFLPRLTGLAFDVLTEPEPRLALLRVSGLLLVAAVAAGVFELLTMVGIELLAQRFERDARAELTLSLLSKSQAFHNRQQVGDVMARAANDVRELNLMFSPGIQLIFDSLLSTVTPLVFIGLIEPRLLLVPVLAVIALAFALRDYLRRYEPVAAGLRESFGALNASLNETVSGIELVKAAAAENQEKRRFLNKARAVRDYTLAQGNVQGRYLPVLIMGLTLVLVFAHGLLLLSDGLISTGDLIAVLGLTGLLRSLSDHSIFTFALVQLGVAGAERILELVTADSEVTANPGGHSARIAGRIEFNAVAFSWPGADAPALSGVTFTVNPGETVALVGQTGSGKTTLTKLLNRTFDASAGTVLIDGVDVRDWNLASLRGQVSVIEQEVFLFSRSIAANIAFGLPGATREQVIAAAQAARAHEFITAFPGGYDTVIGERGATLSGGQRQRLAIARALLTDPRILVLDDATSAIDSATEDEIQQALRAVMRGRTSLLITHRLSQIRQADRILLFGDRTVTDQGTHEELLSRNAEYRRIFRREG